MENRINSSKSPPQPKMTKKKNTTRFVPQSIVVTDNDSLQNELSPELGKEKDDDASAE